MHLKTGFKNNSKIRVKLKIKKIISLKTLCDLFTNLINKNQRFLTKTNTRWGT